MRTHFRAAALAAAAIGLCAAAGFTAPSLASETESGPALSYLEHAAVAVQAAEFGVNVLDETASDPAVQSTAPVAVHAGAPALPAPVPAESPGGDADVERDGRSLAALVDDFAASETNDEQTDCLARAVYYESKGEPLSGQLTVAEVVINRAESGRFPSSLCGVVRQRGQFSFVRGGHIPTPPQGRDWRTAVAIARIAMQDLADGGAPRALFFHARHVRPGWRHTRVATIGNHIFYR